MTPTQIESFKDLLSISSKTYKEELMVEFLCETLDSFSGIKYFLDEHQNIYVTKGEVNEGEYFPLFISHTDTVHELVDEIVVKEEYLKKPPTFGRTFSEEQFLCLKGYLPNGMPTGIGGDDKCGIFIGLELLKILPTVKVAFFVSEETGCHGSRHCDIDFLNDVGYAIQFDAPGNHLITEFCSGVQLFEKNGDFIKKVIPIFENVMGISPELQSHPYTDISQVRIKSDFSCINFSCGYYNMHRDNEFVVIDDVKKSIEMAQKIVETLKFEKHFFKNQSIERNFLYDMFYEEKDESGLVETDNFYFHTSEEQIEIESKSTGDVITLEVNEILNLYDVIRQWLLSNNDY